jgi:hypothetical protein
VKNVFIVVTVLFLAASLNSFSQQGFVKKKKVINLLNDDTLHIVIKQGYLYDLKFRTVKSDTIPTPPQPNIFTSYGNILNSQDLLTEQGIVLMSVSEWKDTISSSSPVVIVTYSDGIQITYDCPIDSIVHIPCEGAPDGIMHVLCKEYPVEIECDGESPNEDDSP